MAVDWFNYFVVLAVVGLMLLGLYAVVRGLSRGRLLSSTGKRLVTIVESTPVAQSTVVHVAKVGSRYLLIGGGAGHLTALGEIPAEEVEQWLTEQRALFAQQTRPFAALLAALRGKPR
jgi:flagellar biogenesis protein FliO